MFADINLASFNIDPAGIEALITPRTKAILLCLFGLVAEMEAINAISRRHGLWVVEDAAVALVPRFRAIMWAPWEYGLLQLSPQGDYHR